MKTLKPIHNSNTDFLFCFFSNDFCKIRTYVTERGSHAEQNCMQAKNLDGGARF
jgi:hypothetical protein